MKKFLRLFALLALCLCLSLCIFTACDNTPQEEGFTLSFSGGDGAEGTMEPLTLKEGEEVQLPSNAFTKSGYAFIGWSDGATLYDVGDTFKMPAKDVTMTAEWQVTEKTVTTITQVSDVSKTYDGQPAAAPTFKTNSDATAQIEWYKGDTKLQSAPADAGDYSVLITLPETELYTTCKELKTFTISKADIPFTATGWADKADGQEHKITVATEVEGATITYSTQEDGEYTAENPGFSAKGKHEVFFKITAGANYNEASGKALVNIMINVASSRIEIQNPQGYTYDAEEQDVEIKVFYTEEGQPEKEYEGNFDIEFAVKEGGRLGENQKPLGAGKYTVKVTVDAADEGELAGYAIDDEEELTVNKATLTVNASDTVKVFAVEDYELVCEYVGFKGNDDESVITGTATANINGLSNTTAAGVHTGTVNVEGLSAADYDIQAGTCTVTVEKEDLIIEELGAVVTVDGQPYTVTTQGIIDYNSQVSVDYARGYEADDSGDFDITGVQIESSHSGKAIGPVTVCANAKLRVYTITYGELQIAGAKTTYTVEDEEFQLPDYTESTTGFFKGWKHNGETITSVNPQDLEFELEDLTLTADLVDVVGANLFAEDGSWIFKDTRYGRMAYSDNSTTGVSGNYNMDSTSWDELKQGDSWVVDIDIASINTDRAYILVEPKLEVTKFVKHIQETAHSATIKLKVEVTGPATAVTQDSKMTYSLHWGDAKMGADKNGHNVASDFTYMPSGGTFGQVTEVSIPLPAITEFKDSESYWLVFGLDLKKSYTSAKITFMEFKLSEETVKGVKEEMLGGGFDEWKKGGQNGSNWHLNGDSNGFGYDFKLGGLRTVDNANAYSQPKLGIVNMNADMQENYSQNVSSTDIPKYALYNSYEWDGQKTLGNRFETENYDIASFKESKGYLNFSIMLKLTDESDNSLDKLTVGMYFVKLVGSTPKRASHVSFKTLSLEAGKFAKTRLPFPTVYNDGNQEVNTTADYQRLVLFVLAGDNNGSTMKRFECWFTGFEVEEVTDNSYDISEFSHTKDGKNVGSTWYSAPSVLGEYTSLPQNLAQSYNEQYSTDCDVNALKLSPNMSAVAGTNVLSNATFYSYDLAYLGDTAKLKVRVYIEVTGGTEPYGKVKSLMFASKNFSEVNDDFNQRDSKLQEITVNTWQELTFDVNTVLSTGPWNNLTLFFLLTEYLSNNTVTMNIYVESIMLVSEAV